MIKDNISSKEFLNGDLPTFKYDKQALNLTKKNSIFKAEYGHY
jgi:hypothetical protein